MVRKNNRKGVRRQSRATPQPEPSAKCSGESSCTPVAAPKRILDGGTLPVTGVAVQIPSATAPPSATLKQPVIDHYLYMRAVGKRAAMINNEIRILACQDTKNFSTVDVLEIHGQDLLERVELSIERIIQSRNLNNPERCSRLFDTMQFVIKVMKQGRAEETKINGESEGLYIRSCGRGKAVSNYFRLVCGLPTVDMSDPTPDILEITGERLEHIDMSHKMSAIHMVLGGNTGI